MGKRCQYNIFCLGIYYCLYGELTGLWLAWVFVIKVPQDSEVLALMTSMRSAPMVLHPHGCGYSCWQEKNRMNTAAYAVVNMLELFFSSVQWGFWSFFCAFEKAVTFKHHSFVGWGVCGIWGVCFCHWLIKAICRKQYPWGNSHALEAKV